MTKNGGTYLVLKINAFEFKEGKIISSDLEKTLDTNNYRITENEIFVEGNSFGNYKFINENRFTLYKNEQKYTKEKLELDFVRLEKTKTKLIRATIILHELIHAYFMSLYDDYHNGNPPNLIAYDDFAYLFDLYVNKKYPSTMAPSIHHQQMATDYADAIARALQEYQTGIPVPDNILPNQIYQDLAYGSLMDSPAVFDSLFPIGNPNRQRIINRYTAEQNGTPIAQGTPNQQNPIGQPCN